MIKNDSKKSNNENYAKVYANELSDDELQKSQQEIVKKFLKLSI